MQWNHCLMCEAKSTFPFCDLCVEGMTPDIRQIFQWIFELGSEREKHVNAGLEQNVDSDAAFLATSLPPSLVRLGNTLYRRTAGLELEDDTEQEGESMAQKKKSKLQEASDRTNKITKERAAARKAAADEKPAAAVTKPAGKTVAKSVATKKGTLPAFLKSQKPQKKSAKTETA